MKPSRIRIGEETPSPPSCPASWTSPAGTVRRSRSGRPAATNPKLVPSASHIFPSSVSTTLGICAFSESGALDTNKSSGSHTISMCVSAEITFSAITGPSSHSEVIYPKARGRFSRPLTVNRHIVFPTINYANTYPLSIGGPSSNLRWGIPLALSRVEGSKERNVRAWPHSHTVVALSGGASLSSSSSMFPSGSYT